MRVRWLFNAAFLTLAITMTSGGHAQTTGLEAMQEKILRSWAVDDSAQPNNYSVTLRLWILKDGAVQDVRIENQAQMSDPAYRAFAESAKQAAMKASPLPVPPTQAEDYTNG